MRKLLDLDLDLDLVLVLDLDCRELLLGKRGHRPSPEAVPEPPPQGLVEALGMRPRAVLVPEPPLHGVVVPEPASWRVTLDTCGRWHCRPTGALG